MGTHFLAIGASLEVRKLFPFMSVINKSKNSLNRTILFLEKTLIGGMCNRFKKGVNKRTFALIIPCIKYIY